MLRTGYLQVLLATLGILITLVPAAESQSALPRRLTLPQAENLLIERNLTVLAARYQIDANRAGRLIASYKPNPVLTINRPARFRSEEHTSELQSRLHL